MEPKNVTYVAPVVLTNSLMSPSFLELRDCRNREVGEIVGCENRDMPTRTTDHCKFLEERNGQSD